MKYPVGWLGLSTTVAIALLLPTPAQADTLTLREDTEGQPTALTSEAFQPESRLEGASVVETATDVPATDTVETDATEAIAPTVEAEVGESEAIEPTVEVADSPPLSQPAAVIVIEPGDSSQAQDEALLPLPASTDSHDLQAIAAPSTSENSFPTPLAQPLDIAQTAAASSQRWHFFGGALYLCTL